MAIKKHIINSNGIPSEYHKIRSVEKRRHDIMVILDAYTSETYRNMERTEDKTKEIEKLIKERDTLKETLDTWSDEDYQKYDEIQDAIALLHLTTDHADVSYVLYQTNIIIDINDLDEISFKDIYKHIKQTDKFNGAKDC